LNKPILILIQILFGTVSRIAPKLAGKAAFRLFCTTFKPAVKSAKNKAILLDAQRRFDAAIQHTVTYTGGTVIAYEFLPDSADDTNQLKTVWLVHGWQSHSLYMSHFVEPFLQSGFRVVSVDLPGHGKSSGRTFHLPLAVVALNAVINKLDMLDRPARFNHIVSHSLGGAVVATTLAGTLTDQPQRLADKLVLISSPDSMPSIFNNFASMIGLAPKATNELHAMVTRLTGKVTDDFSTGIQLQNVSAELLLLHAPDDKEIAYSEAEAITQSNPDAMLMPVPGKGHRRIIADEKVVQTAVDFIIN